MLIDAPLAVILVCGGAQPRMPAVHDFCLGCRVIARLVLAGANPSPAELPEAAAVTATLGAPRILVLYATGWSRVFRCSEATEELGR